MSSGCNPFKLLWVKDYAASGPDLDRIIVLVNHYMRRYGDPPEVVYIPDPLMRAFEQIYTVQDPYPHIEYIYRGMSIARGNSNRLYAYTPEGGKMYGD